MTELFAQNAKNPAALGLPSEEELARWLCAHEGHTPEQVEALWAEWLDNACELLGMFRPAFEAKERRCQMVCDSYAEENQRLHDRALSAEAKLAQAVEELSGLRQAILDAAVICDDDEKAGDRLDKLARAIRARSASRGEKT